MKKQQDYSSNLFNHFTGIRYSHIILNFFHIWQADIHRALNNQCLHNLQINLPAIYFAKINRYNHSNIKESKKNGNNATWITTFYHDKVTLRIDAMLVISFVIPKRIGVTNLPKI